MLLFYHFTLGFFSSYFGSLTPSMLNMTAAKISINKGKNSAIQFATGVSIVVFIQAYIAVIFTRFLRSNPWFLHLLQQIAVVIFLFLSYYFYKQFKKDKIEIKETKQASKNSFVIGLILSSLNMFSIPFYCGITTAFDGAGWLHFSQIYIITFVIGSAIGTFVLLFTYLQFAQTIAAKSKTLAKNLHLILSFLTGILALITFYKIL